MENMTYCGDGVYAEFNGYSIDLKVNDHRNPTAVVLEDTVLQSLVNFARSKGMTIK